MRLIVTLLALLAAHPAFAQEIVWAAEAVTAQRFPDAEVAGPAIEEGARLKVLARQDDLVRVQVGTDFGWVGADAVVDTPPVPDVEPTGGDVQFDASAIEAMLQDREVAEPGPDATEPE